MGVQAGCLGIGQLYKTEGKNCENELIHFMLLTLPYSILTLKIHVISHAMCCDVHYGDEADAEEGAGIARARLSHLVCILAAGDK